MSPELLDLLRKATEARRRGLPADRINERINAATEGRFSDFRSLAIAARDAGISREELGRPTPASEPEGRPGIGTALSDFVRIGGNAITGGLLAEAAGLAAGVGAAIVPGGKGFSEAREAERSRSRARTAEATERAGDAAIVPQVAGAVAGPGKALAAGGRALGRATGTRGAATLAARGGRTAARSLVSRLPAGVRGAVGDAIQAVETGTMRFPEFRRAVLAAVRGTDVAADVARILRESRNVEQAARALRIGAAATAAGGGNPVEGARRVVGGLLGN